MKAHFFSLAVASLILFISCATNQNPELNADKSDHQTTYDTTLAAELGADDYGMRSYVMAFLKSGPNRSSDSLQAAKLQRAHLDNITRLAEEGKLVFAGPFMDDFEVRGIYIFAVENMAEAKELTATDPAIKAGTLVMELHPFYGSAALMQVNEIHEKIAKINI